MAHSPVEYLEHLYKLQNKLNPIDFKKAKQMEADSRNNTWIDAFERPPDTDNEILAKSPTGIVHICHWRRSYGIFTCQMKSESVLGWLWKPIE